MTFILNGSQTHCTFANCPFRDQWLRMPFSKNETHSVYVQNVDIRGRKECVLHERCNHVPRVQLMRRKNQRLGIIFKLKPPTWMIDAMTYNPIVATSDRTMSRNIAFEKRSLNLAPRCSASATCCTPLIARKIAANCVRLAVSRLTCVEPNRGNTPTYRA